MKLQMSLHSTILWSARVSRELIFMSSKSTYLRNSCSEKNSLNYPKFLFPLVLQVAFSSLPQVTVFHKHCSSFRFCPSTFVSKLVYYIYIIWKIADFTNAKMHKYMPIYTGKINYSEPHWCERPHLLAHGCWDISPSRAEGP